MKNLPLVLKSSLYFILVLAMPSAYGKSIARILAVKGTAFVVSQGVTIKVKSGDYLEDFSEILTEESGQISFVDFHDHTFHLSSSGHVKIMNKITELRSGNLWVQSENRKESFSVQTSNSNSEYKHAEFIIDYDNNKGKSQVMVINGDVDFSNILESHLKYNVQAGQFSFVDQEYENGLPRNPTHTGFKSFKMAMKSFDGIKPTDQGFMDVMDAQLKDDSNHENGRAIASVDGASSTKAKGKIIFISSLKKGKSNERLPASVKSAKDYYKNLVGKSSVSSHSSHSGKSFKGAKAVVRVFGASDMDEVTPKFPKKTEVVEPKEMPSNVVKAEEMPKTVDEMLGSSEPMREPSSTKMAGQKAMAPVTTENYEQKIFDRSLMEEYEEQKRHPNEVNELIDELKNFREDFNKTY